MADDVIEKNVFGQPVKDGQIVEMPAPAAPAADDKKPDGGKVEDIENHPLVKELRAQIEAVKKEYGGNLSGQRDKISRLEKQIADISKGAKPEEKPKPIFDKIVFSKDLPKEERDEMTPRERELHDELMTTRQRINEMAATNAPKPDAAKEGDGSTFDVVKGVQDAAMKLAEGNYLKATQLVEKFNALGFDLSQITAENVAERVASVADLIPDFKPKKEQETTRGGAVRSAGASSGVDSVVAAAAADRSAASNGNYEL